MHRSSSASRWGDLERRFVVAVVEITILCLEGRVREKQDNLSVSVLLSW